MTPLPLSRQRQRPNLPGEAFGTEPLADRVLISPTGLDLALPLPPSITHQYATVNARRVLSAMGRAYKDQVGKRVLMALGHAPCRQDLLRTLRSSDLTLSIRFFFVSPLRRDVDGGLKIAQDALCEALGINDNRIHEIHLYKHRDPARPRIEISLGLAAQSAKVPAPHPARTPRR